MDQRGLFLSTLRREQSSYVPLFPRDLTLGLDSANASTDAVFGQGRYDPELSAACVLSLQRRLASDCTVGCIFTYGLEAFGGVTEFPPKGIPYVKVPPVKDEDTLDSLNPTDITEGYLFKGMRRSCEIVREKRPDLALAVNVPGPMTMAGFARGVETLLMDLMLNPDLADRILVFSVAAIADEMIGMSEGIADAVFFASATDNPDMVGDSFTEHSVPGIRVLTELAHRQGLLSMFHPHGVFSTEDREELLKMSVDTGIDCFQFSEGNEFEYIADACRGRCSVMGGVDAYTTLLLGPDDRIRRDTMRFIDGMRDDPFILSCSCSVNRGLSLDNLKVMADTVHSYNGGSQ